MNKQSPTVWVVVVSFLAAYFLIGILLTGSAASPIGVLFLALVLWFSVYKLRYKDRKNGELLTSMCADLMGVVEGIKEKIAQEEAHRRAAAEREEQARTERERRKASRPARDPTVGKYADMIENKVREGERNKQDSEEE